MNPKWITVQDPRPHPKCNTIGGDGFDVIKDASIRWGDWQDRMGNEMYNAIIEKGLPHLNRYHKLTRFGIVDTGMVFECCQSCPGVVVITISGTSE